jgi:hypothetical protein
MIKKQSEHILQKQIVALLRKNGIDTVGCDVMSGLMFAGGDINKRYAFISHQKAIGATKGQPDLILLLKDGETLLVELKNGKQGSQSLEQKKFQERCMEIGHNYVVWRKFEDAVDFVNGYRAK